ncbi:MAG: GNAT family N-acetyltransferase [Oscillospiraceae bacterium]|nr:GNAT family N-acetyltransferase [Oscillospiraceae bacterium]
MTDLYFIRHAESFGNLTRRAYGWYDGILTPKGYRQAECLRKRFADIAIDAVYSSDLTRARETAAAIYEPKGLALHTDAAFREISLGAWEDRPWGELPSLYPEAYENWLAHPLAFRVEHSESYADVYARIKPALDRAVCENEGRTIAVVSHGAAIRILMYGITHNGDLTDIEKSDWGDNTCVSRFRFENGKYTEIFKNDNSHLSAMPGFSDNMNWVREGGGRNVWFEYAEYPRDKEKIRTYHAEAWLDIFGDEIANIRDVDSKARRVLKKSSDNIAFAYCTDGEIGMIETDEDIKLYPSAGHISLVYLKPEYRRRRYGIQLIGHAMSKYGNMGKKHLSVRVSETNKSAYAFYKKYGFYEAFRETEDKVRQIVMLLDIGGQNRV